MHLFRGLHIKKCLAVLWFIFFLSSLQLYLRFVRNLKFKGKDLSSLKTFLTSGLLPRTGSNASSECQLDWTELVSWTPFHPNSSDALSKMKYTMDGQGVWSPTDCVARSHLAVVIPYRDRQEHLNTLLSNLHRLLQAQRLAYAVFVIEEVGDKKLNRGTLRNIGYREADKLDSFQCFLFHDVDLIPLNATNMYACGQQPTHLSSAIDTFKYKLPYKEIFGGVVALTKTQFESANGYSNRFFHWGGEDDDMYSRLYAVGWRIQRRELEKGRYRMLHHNKSVKNPYRFLQGWYDIKTELWKSDGLKDLNYSVVSTRQYPLYTWLLVDIDDSKAGDFIEEAIEEIRNSLPERFRNLTDKSIGDAVIELQQYYRGPYQVLKVIEEGVKAVNPLIH